MKKQIKCYKKKNKIKKNYIISTLTGRSMMCCKECLAAPFLCTQNATKSSSNADFSRSNLNRKNKYVKNIIEIYYHATARNYIVIQTRITEIFKFKLFLKSSKKFFGFLKSVYNRYIDADRYILHFKIIESWI